MQTSKVLKLITRWLALSINIVQLVILKKLDREQPMAAPLFSNICTQAYLALSSLNCLIHLDRAGR